MTNMNFTRHSSKKTSILAAASICLVAIGAAAWVGVGSKITQPTDSANNSNADSRPSYVYEPSDGAMDDYETPTAPNKPQENEQSKAPTPSKNDAVATVTPSAGFFVLPMTGDIIKDFNDSELQYSLTYNDWRLHTALDIKGVTGSAVNAAGDGIVTSIYEDRQYGLTVEINHGNDIVATYSGLETVIVAVGDVVAVNMQIATLGKVPCESVETSHLHFSVKKGGTLIPPLNIMGV